MTRLKFLELLRKRLNGIPKDDIDKTIEYYKEILSDKVDDGMSEEEAIRSLGDIDSIVDLTISEIPLNKLIKARLGLNEKLKTWKIILLASTFYIWIPLLIALFAVTIAVYASLWSGVIALGASSLASSATALITFVGIIDVFTGNIGSGIVLIGLGIGAAGVAILLGILTIKLSKIMIIVCKKLVIKIKGMFIKRGEEND